MSLVTIPVRIEHGRVIPKEGATLPEQGEGVLTVAPLAEAAPTKTMSQPLETTLAERLEAVAQMKGIIILPEEDPNDPRLNYLLRKYCK
jgi:hypothetical protein